MEVVEVGMVMSKYRTQFHVKLRKVTITWITLTLPESGESYFNDCLQYIAMSQCSAVDRTEFTQYGVLFGIDLTWSQETNLPRMPNCLPATSRMSSVRSSMNWREYEPPYSHRVHGRIHEKKRERINGRKKNGLKRKFEWYNGTLRVGISGSLKQRGRAVVSGRWRPESVEAESETPKRCLIMVRLNSLFFIFHIEMFPHICRSTIHFTIEIPNQRNWLSTTTFSDHTDVTPFFPCALPSLQRTPHLPLHQKSSHLNHPKITAFSNSILTPALLPPISRMPSLSLRWTRLIWLLKTSANSHEKKSGKSPVVLASATTYLKTGELFKKRYLKSFYWLFYDNFTK